MIHKGHLKINKEDKQANEKCAKNMSKQLN